MADDAKEMEKERAKLAAAIKDCADKAAAQAQSLNKADAAIVEVEKG